MIPKEDEYAYSHQVLQATDVFIKNFVSGTIEKSSLNYLSRSYMAIFSSLRGENSKPFTVDLQNSASTGEAKLIVNTVLSINDKSEVKNLVSSIQLAINSLLNKNLENKVLLIDLTNIVTFSAFLEAIYRKIHSAKLEVLTVDTLKQIEGNQKIMDNSLKEMSHCLRAIKENKLNVLDSSPLENLSLEGIVQIFIHSSIISNQGGLGNKTKDFLLKTFKVRRLYYLKRLAEHCSLLNLIDNLKSPTPVLLSTIFLNATILHILDYDLSISLPRYDARAYVDSLGDFGISEIELKRKTKELLTFTPYIRSPEGGISGKILSMKLHKALAISLVGWSTLIIVLAVNQLVSVPYILVIELILVGFLVSYDISMILEAWNKWTED